MKDHSTRCSYGGPDESAPQKIRWPQPGELWSLWEMFRTNARDFVEVSEMIAAWERTATEMAIADGLSDMPVEGREILDKLVQNLSKYMKELMLPVSERLLADVVKSQTLGEMSRTFDAFNRARMAEMEAVKLLALRSDLADFLGMAEPFGAEVAAAFSGSAEDIQSASSCLALEQPTACVFHLMRAMESAVGALCARLSIAKPDREWGKLLADIHKAIEPMPLGARRNAWSAAHSNLYHVKQAWRNDTMHPKQTYTIEQAKEVFQACKVFMAHLAGLV